MEKGPPGRRLITFCNSVPRPFRLGNLRAPSLEKRLIPEKMSGFEKKLGAREEEGEDPDWRKDPENRGRPWRWDRRMRLSPGGLPGTSPVTPKGCMCEHQLSVD